MPSPHAGPSSKSALEQSLAQAMGHLQAGRLDQAQSLCRHILLEHPNSAHALHLLAVVALQQKKPEAAVDFMQQALALAPQNPLYHAYFGEALLAKDDLPAAAAAFQKALELHPQFPEALNSLSQVYHRLERLEDAIAASQKAITHRPNSAEFLSNLGYHLNALARFDEAIHAYQRALTLMPSHPAILTNLGNSLQACGRLHEAIASYRQALQSHPDFAKALNALGVALHESGQFDQALNTLRQARQVDPCDPQTLDSLGSVLKGFGLLDESVTSFREALKLQPHNAAAHSNLILTLQYHPAYDGRQLQNELHAWYQHHAQGLAQPTRAFEHSPDPARRLRIGYVSPDFRNHVVGDNIRPLLREHDHQQIEVFCYSNVLNPDESTQEFRRYSDHWRNIAGVSDDGAAELIRTDNIDILVDLALHTAHNRLLLFARKPALIQATFAGYPGSTGLPTIDYRLTDSFLEDGQSLSTENPLPLPNSFWCYDRKTSEPPVNGLPAHLRGVITFGCLNNPCKVNSGVVNLWAQVLTATGNSRLLIQGLGETHRHHILETFARAHISPQRIEFVPLLPKHQYLERYHQIDIGLDTFPYNGHTTSLDAFWMGVPVVTLVGKTIVGRAGLSQLMNLGLPELIAHTPEQFIQIATSLARDIPRLQELRQTLRARMQASPLMDAPRFARDIEAAYRLMWQKWCSTH